MIDHPASSDAHSAAPGHGGDRPEPATAGIFDPQLLDRCISCGFCLPVCPTYALTGQETSSPRGRITLMRALETGRLPDGDPTLAEEASFCLGCRACETVCPAGVQYGELLEQWRDHQWRGRNRPLLARLLMAVVSRPGLLGLQGLVRRHATGRGRPGGRAIPGGAAGPTRTGPARTGATRNDEPRTTVAGSAEFDVTSEDSFRAEPLFGAVGSGGTTGADTTAERAASGNPSSAGTASVTVSPCGATGADTTCECAASQSSPSADTASGTVSLCGTNGTDATCGCGASDGATGIDAASGSTAPAVAPDRPASLMLGCVERGLYPQVSRAVQRLCPEVAVPGGQGCCGALHAHNGDSAGGRELALKLGERLDGTIVTTAGGCAAHLAHHLGRDRVAELSEYLDRTGYRPTGEVRVGDRRARVTLQDSCHLRNALGVSRQPRDLIAAVADYVELPNAGDCCGAAGTYSLLRPADSRAVFAPKLEAIEAADVDYIVALNPGCLRQLHQNLRRARSKVKAIHLAELLAMAEQAKTESTPR